MMKAISLSKASKNSSSAQSKKTLQERELTHSLFFMSVLALAFFSPYAQAQSLTVLYEFTGSPDGAGSYARLVQDSTGNLYGTTPIGGTNNGTVFEVSSQGNETLLHTFRGNRDGFLPGAGLVIDASGKLYGTTVYGGTHNLGTVFELNKAGTKIVLFAFSGPDGANPWADLVRDAAGNLYGTTAAGGSGNCNNGSGCGTVFLISANGTETVLHSFAGGVADGQTPFAGLLRDADGNLYGTTNAGGTAGFGTVFELSATGTETILHNFAGYLTDGMYPQAGLVRDKAGDLFGTTLEGGAYGYGTVFKLNKTGKEKLLYSFGSTGTDGKNPGAGLVRDTAGNLYGTTEAGGGTGCNGNGCGTVFELTKARVEKVLYSFDTANAGAVPFAALILDAAGDLYGTTSNGGAGFGTVFKITP
jgi:uncharacterized repeat protein (TIGR03803 family)